MELSPTIAKVLQRYPDVAPGSLTFPADAVEWTEAEVELFVGSGGFIKPKRKKAEAPPAGEGYGKSEVKPEAKPEAKPAEIPELPLTTWREGAYWAPYATYMEDVGEKGLRLTAALNKCERFRNVGLKKGAGFNLNTLKEKFQAGILLREFLSA